MDYLGEVFGPGDPTIVDAHVDEVTDRMRNGGYNSGNLPKVMVAYSDNTEGKLFDFYPDDIGFTKEELIGLTKEQALKLKEKKMNRI